MKAALKSGVSYDIARAVQACPGAFTVSPAKRARFIATWLSFSAFTVFCMWKTGLFDVHALIMGIGRLGGAVSFMFPPASHGALGELLFAMLQTLAMAFLGTLLSAAASIPLGFLGAKNVISQPIFHFALRGAFDVIRGIDSLIWALVFVNVVGLGPFTGILALAVSDTGTLSKLFAEAIENVDSREVEGVRASGACRILTMRFGILPQVLPVFLSQMLYFFESNTRSATILGVVGAGGIGLELSDRIRLCNWDEALFIIIIILVTISIIDMVSKMIRQNFIGNNSRQA